jgi:hypothetical protein
MSDIPSDWRQFEDILGLFTIYIPPDWSNYGRADHVAPHHPDAAVRWSEIFYMSHDEPRREGHIEVEISATPIGRGMWDSHRSGTPEYVLRLHGLPVRVMAQSEHHYILQMCTEHALYNIHSPVAERPVTQDTQRVFEKMPDTLQVLGHSK